MMIFVDRNLGLAVCFIFLAFAFPVFAADALFSAPVPQPSSPAYSPETPYYAETPFSTPAPAPIIEAPGSASPTPSFPFYDLFFPADSMELYAPSPSPSGDEEIPDQAPSGAVPVPAPSPHSDGGEDSPAPSPGGGADGEPPQKYGEEGPSPVGDNADSPYAVQPIDEEGATSKNQMAENSSGENGKAGVAFGVIGAACLVGAGAFVYKKRQENLQRSQFGYRGRIEMI